MVFERDIKQKNTAAGFYTSVFPEAFFYTIQVQEKTRV